MRRLCRFSEMAGVSAGRADGVWLTATSSAQEHTEFPLPARVGHASLRPTPKDKKPTSTAALSKHRMFKPQSQSGNTSNTLNGPKP